MLIASPAEFNGGGRVLDAVVAVLGCRWPLSLRAVYFAVAKQCALGVSYQAVHKALKQLVAEGVVVKEDREYCLSIDWIRNVKRFGASLEEAYTRNQLSEKLVQLPYLR